MRRPTPLHLHSALPFTAAWTGFVVTTLGFGIAAAISALVSTFVSSADAYGGTIAQASAPGTALTGIACALSFIAAILGSVAGCKLGPLPGIGEGSCCCPAHNIVGNVQYGAPTATVIVGNPKGAQFPAGGTTAGAPAGMYEP